MISIRLRIITLSTVALIAVATAFYIQYQDIEKKLSIEENSVQAIKFVRPLSQLVHSLQKERGLSAGQMIGNDNSLRTFLMKQREITSAQLIDLSATNILQGHQFVENFSDNLKIIRDRMDSDLIEWIELRDFYTSAVQDLLEIILLKTVSLDYSTDTIYNPKSLSYIASSRENLGLIRASLNRVYQKGRGSMQELMFINHQYITLKSNLRTFEALTNARSMENNDSVFLTEIKDEVFYSVIAQIEKILKPSGETISGSPSIWWREATQVINTIKKIEDTVFDQIERDSLKQMAYYKNFIYWYGLSALIVLIVVISLTVLTIHRILKAFYILLHSLDSVQQTQDYGLRIPSDSKDEFGQLSYSINSLLSYTDTIIKDKEYLATTDLLTNIMNRRSFTAVAEKEIIRSERYKKPLSIIYCDIDFFKLVNDKYGHAIGDEVLKKFVETIKIYLRSSDYFGRWGGEEFIIMALEVDLSDAVKLAEKLRKEIMSLSIDPIGNLTSSFGVAQKQEGESFVALCERADRALYQAKDTGRNKVCFSE